MSAERAGVPIILALVRDVVLAPKVTHMILKDYRTLPLPVVGGGAPITRH